jgi:hypothetical protein
MAAGLTEDNTRYGRARKKRCEMEHERLVKAEQTAALLVSDLLDIHKHTDNLPLEELMLEEIERVQRLHRRLKRFSGQA